MRTFRLVKPGARVRNARITDIIASTNYPAPKIWTKANPAHAGTIFVNWQSSLIIPFGTVKLMDSLPHGLPYVPSVFATFKFDNGSIRREGTLPFQDAALGMITIDADIVNINLKFYSTDISGITAVPAFTLTARYYVVVEPGL